MYFTENYNHAVYGHMWHSTACIFLKSKNKCRSTRRLKNVIFIQTNVDHFSNNVEVFEV